MHSILVIDDEQGIREVLTDILQDEGYRVFTADDGYKGLEILKTEPIDLVFLDIWMPGIGGIEVLQKIVDEFPGIEVVVISGHANIEMAVRAVKLGAYDLLEKPLSMDRILLQCRNIFELEQLRRENKELKVRLGAEVEMVGESPGIAKIREIIGQAAASDATVMITGENGTGKELVAREIHENSKRRNAPFVAVNCAAIPENLIESELFGHEKGAFTGAVGRRKGKFELAHGGSLFLDEVADLSLPAQAKILRAIQERRIERLGGEESIAVDVRIVAATNRPVREMIASGEFREDLYYRLHVVPIDVPPLRDRDGDIDLLAEHFLASFDGGGRTFSSEAMDELKKYQWPGNIRQFRNVVQRISVMSDDRVVPAEAVILALEGEMQFNRISADPVLIPFEGMSLGEAKDAFERQLILQKLEETGYNITKAAQLLGIYPSNLHNKIRKYGIETKK
jgi:two-component system nitrogen regulation response regulator NtrX